MSQNDASEFCPRFQGSDFDEMVDTFKRHFGPFDASPSGSAEPFNWKADYWSRGPMSLISGQYHGSWQVRAEPETAEWLSILLPREGALDISLGRDTIEGTPGKLVLVNNHEVERCQVRGAPHDSDILRLDWAIIAQAVAGHVDISPPGSLGLSSIIDLSNTDGRLIGSLAQTIVTGMRHNGPLLRSPIAMSNLSHALADLVVQSVPHRLSHLIGRKTFFIAPWHVRDAINFMHVNMARPITISMVAEAVGISTRSLETGFRSFRETTPSAFLRKIRLRAAREDLLDASNPESVKDICLKWGFFHLGRFSAAYRDAYGERPSDTKRRQART
ncbi:AraC family transcriptional regulator [Rhizobium sp. RMa-01]|uniref:AraC family transcriptional regulator n=1 Tax=unclassified Rhizobium TaxID=2613769 RepID=UPI0008D95E4D|nr:MULTISPECIES: helix-turn-helix transcriptional regulator [unclassified Rhizobium]OHV24858.1 AraC family transcriptional regulator [Rhizobium sp. RSm-3]RVU08755.1 AraC family transcriptional regulator [Rhizobium sp. RMa-01]